MNAKKCLALILSACMAVSMLAGCKDGDKKPSSGSSSNGSTTSGSVTWIDPDYDADDGKGEGNSNHNSGNTIKPRVYTVVVEGLGENGTVTPKSPIKVKKGDDVEFTLTAKEGYYIQSIKIGSTELVPNADSQVSSYKVTMKRVCSNRTVTVKLAAMTYGIVAYTYGDQSSKVTWEGKDFKLGDEVMLLLTHSNDYVLTSITVNGVEMKDQVSNDRLTIAITGSMNVEAYFETKPTIVTGGLKKDGALKTKYSIGDAFDPTGLTAKFTYSDGHVENVALMPALIEPVTVDNNESIIINCIGYDCPLLVDFEKLGITVQTTDKNGNGVSSYLSQDDFDEIKTYLEQKADRGQYSAAGDNASIKESLKKGQIIAGWNVITTCTFESKSFDVHSKDGILKLIDDNIGAYDGHLTQAIKDPKANGNKVYVYMNITDAAVTVWFVAEK